MSAIRDFAERELTELADDDDDVTPTRSPQMAELGWYGLTIDEEYGGSGGSFLDATLFLEETRAAARRSAATASR